MSLQSAVGSNVINTAEARVTGRVVVENFGAAFVGNPSPHSHAVQFYEDEEFLFETVGDFLHFAHVCERHSHVVPTEEFARLEAGARSSEVARLQQDPSQLHSRGGHSLRHPPSL
jgi:hypothetical protein